MTAPDSTCVIQGSERRPMPSARAIAPAAPDERFEVKVQVRPRQPFLSVEAWIAQSADPGRHEMTHAQYEAAFGADPADLLEVENFARGSGLTVVDSSVSRRCVTLSGTVATFSKAFRVALSIFDHPGGRYRGRSGAIHVPPHLAEIVEGVFGFDDRPFPRPESP
jgi:kumamolisin